MRSLNRFPWVVRLASLPALAVLVVLQPSAGAAAPSGSGEIRGVVLNITTGRPVRDHAISLTGLQREAGGQLTRRARTDAQGHFSFEDLPAGSGRLYGLHVDYQGGLFVKAPVSVASGNRPTRANVAVYPTTTDPSVIRFSSDRMFVLPGKEGRLGVLEFVSIVNDSDHAYIGRAPAMASDAKRPEGRAPRASLAFYLPAGGSDVAIEDSSLVIPQLVPSPFGFGVTVAIPPGEHELTYGYRLEGSAGSYELSRVALYPTANYSIFVDESLSLTTDRLQDRGFVTIRGERYREWSAGAFDAGDRIQASATAEAGADPLLVGGIAAFALLLLAGLGVALLRRRRPAEERAPASSPRESPQQEKERVVEAIAELDIRHDSGELSDDEWASSRTDLKERLTRLGERVP